jgi:hypothetical protein
MKADPLRVIPIIDRELKALMRPFGRGLVYLLLATFCLVGKGWLTFIECLLLSSMGVVSLVFGNSTVMNSSIVSGLIVRASPSTTLLPENEQPSQV